MAEKLEDCNNALFDHLGVNMKGHEVDFSNLFIYHLGGFWRNNIDVNINRCHFNK